MAHDPMRPLVIYHGNCQDGSAAAAITHQALPGAEYRPWAYQDPAPPPSLYAGREVYLLDFCFENLVMQALAAAAKRLVVLDHHQTALKRVADIHPPAGSEITIDMTHSGASLAYEYWGRTPTQPGMARVLRQATLGVAHVRDQDLGRWSLPGTAIVHAAYSTLDPDDLVAWWRALCNVGQANRDGVPVLRHINQLVLAQAATARRALLLGHIVWLANATTHWAATAKALAHRDSVTAKPGNPGWAATYRVVCGMHTYSLYSEEENMAALAETQGGGGHKRTAGLTVPHPLHIWEA